MEESVLMAISVPDNPKVYTTKYENYKGVDFTNDKTNVWYRRSPSAVNMLPDASGRPFKRHGWEILLSQDDLLDALSLFDYEETSVTEEEFNESKTMYYTESGGTYTQCDDSDSWDENETYYIRIYPSTCAILKCSYFELAGKDHIVIFTSAGVLFYNGIFTAVYKDDYDCYSGYDRCFFFEGNGISAFYIYGNFKVWRYSYDPTNGSAVDGYVFEDVTDKATIPLLIAGAAADGTGTMINGYNMLGEMASIEYNDIMLKTWWCSDGLQITVPSSWTMTLGTVYKWTYDSTKNPKWDKQSGGTELATAGITVTGTPQDGDEIVAVYAYGVMLPNNANDIAKVKVNVSDSVQYDTPLTVKDVSISAGSKQCRLWADTTAHRSKGKAWIQFADDWSATWGTTGMDFVRVVFPTISVTTTEYNDPTDTDLQFSGTASLNVEVV